MGAVTCIPMMSKKGMLQKISFYSGVISFILAFILSIVVYVRIESIGTNNPVFTSLMATIFFFVSMGVVLTIMGKANLPSFKFDKSDEN